MKKTLEIFEKKIRDKIDEVFGVGKNCSISLEEKEDRVREKMIEFRILMKKCLNHANEGKGDKNE